MSETILNCPQCRRLLRVTEELIGRPVKCPVCGFTFSVPAAGEGPQPVTEVSETYGSPAPNPLPGQDQSGWNADQGREERPWEEPGRRDAEPHRGGLVLALGILSIVTGVFGLPLGLAAWIMGRRDLGKMRANRMDREGKGVTEAGMICGMVGTVFGTLGLLCCFLYLSVAFSLPLQRNFRLQPGPRPIPVPIRPAPPPAAPQQPGNRAVRHELPPRLQDDLAPLA
jgi:hypothetical protein